MNHHHHLRLVRALRQTQTLRLVRALHPSPSPSPEPEPDCPECVTVTGVEEAFPAWQVDGLFETVSSGDYRKALARTMEKGFGSEQIQLANFTLDKTLLIRSAQMLRSGQFGNTPVLGFYSTRN